ncbi:MAG: HAD family hydrolase, partial [Verrucomicrobiota bacterium]|nr:HAD family hydrolase [Verrucomicrobiota bacterium]
LLLGRPPFLANAQGASAFYRAMTLLVVMSPCALVLSVPSAILSAIASGARRGVLLRGGAAIETLADVHIVALDKTKTLTHGVPELVGIDVYAGDEASVLSAAHNLARLSTQPLSRAIQRAGVQRGAPAIDYSHAESHAGSGMTARKDGLLYVLGNREFVRSRLKEAAHDAPLAEDTDVAEVWMASPKLCGRLLLRDELRSEARGMLNQLRSLGMRKSP